MKPKSKKVYRTMQGKIVDLDRLIKRNELTPAVGNARVNARGDELGPGGKIIKKREEVVREYYDGNRPVADEVPVKSTITAEEKKLLDEFDEEVVPPKTQSKKSTYVKPKSADTDDWVEDDNGNFIKKGE